MRHTVGGAHRLVTRYFSSAPSNAWALNRETLWIKMQAPAFLGANRQL